MIWIDLEKINASSNLEYIKKYELLFSEFYNDKGINYLMFYPLITTRNVIFTLSQLYLNDLEYNQKSINLLFSFIIIIFLIIFKPFKDRVVLIANIVSETMISILFLIILMKNIIPYFSKDFYFDCCFVTIILLQLGFQYLLSIFTLLFKLKEICNKYLNPA